MPGVRLDKPEGTYLLWLDFGSFGLPERERIGSAFFKPGKPLDQIRQDTREMVEVWKRTVGK